MTRSPAAFIAAKVQAFASTLSSGASESAHANARQASAAWRVSSAATRTSTARTAGSWQPSAAAAASAAPMASPIHASSISARTTDRTVFSDLDKLALRYTDAMCRTPANVPDDLVAALKAALSHAQLVELTATIAWENYRSRFNRGFDIGSDGFSDGAVCAMPVRAPVVNP